MKVLVVISEPIAGGDIRAALGKERLDEAEFMLIAPALHKSAVRFWVSDADEAIARASTIEEESAARLERDGLAVVADDTAESDLTTAIKDALVTYPAERVVLFLHPPDQGRYRERVDVEALRYELGVALDVIHIEAREVPTNGRPSENGDR